MATLSHARKPSVNSRPTTPLRPPSRTSLRASQTTPSGPLSSSSDPLASLEPAFAELSDSMADLEANFMHLQLLNESLNRFNECFGGFLYGLNMSAFCVDFPEAPTPQSFARAKNFSSPNSKHHPDRNIPTQTAPPDVDATFLTTDTSEDASKRQYQRRSVCFDGRQRSKRKWHCARRNDWNNSRS
ncbi:hypothetical protein MBLNU13_g03731t1 [Cladosporium sp. NU13]